MTKIHLRIGDYIPLQNLKAHIHDHGQLMLLSDDKWRIFQCRECGYLVTDLGRDRYKECYVLIEELP